MSAFLRIIEVQTPQGPVQYAAGPFLTVSASADYGHYIQQSGAATDQGVAHLVNATDLIDELLADTVDVYDLSDLSDVA